MTAVENAQNAMTFIDAVRNAVSLVTGVLSGAFALHGVRALLRKRRRNARTALPEPPGSMQGRALELARDAYDNFGGGFKAPALHSFQRCAPRTCWDYPIRPKRNVSRKCVICGAAVREGTIVCSPGCKRVARCWGYFDD